MGTIIIILLILIVAFIFVVIWLFQNMEKNKEKLATLIAGLESQFGKGDYYIAWPETRSFGISWEREQIIVGISPTTLNAIDLTLLRAITLDIDGVEVTTSQSKTRKDRGSQLASGLVGGVLLGPVGAVVGGMSGSSSTTGRLIAERQIKSVKLVMRIADRVHPIRSFSFSTTYGSNEAVHKARHYHALLTQVIEDRSIPMTGPGIAH